MDGIIAILLIVLGGVGIALLVLPIVSTVIAVKTRRMLRQAIERIELIERELQGRNLFSHLDMAKKDQKVEVENDHPIPSISSVLEKSTDQIKAAALVEKEELKTKEEQETEKKEEEEAKDEKKPIPESTKQKDEHAPPPAEPPQSLEEKIGLVWFTRAGALIGIVVTGWFFKYMVDNDWIGPWGRVLLGWLAGIALLVTGTMLSKRESKKVNPIFTQGLMGLGLALVLVATYSSFAFYHLVPVIFAFIIVATVCMLGGALALYHRAESILGLALLAALANPVMLSTGQDRPLALFLYLLVMTTGSMTLSVKLRFKIVTWMSVLGTLALFAGWYVKFFDASPPPAPGIYDQPAESLQGAYYLLWSRWPAVLFALLFAALWTLLAATWRKTGAKRTSSALTLVASVAIHAAAAALFADHPLVLGASLVALGLVCGWIFTKAELSPWLGLPMVSAFVSLALVAGDLSTARLLPMMIITGGLSAVYFGVVLRSAARQGWLQSLRSMLLFAGAGLGMMLLSAIWLLPDHFNVFALLLTILSAVFLWLALSIASVVFTVGVFLATAWGMGVSGLEPTLTGFDQAVYIGIASSWFITYVFFIAMEMFVKGFAWSRTRLAVLTGAGVGYCALILMVTTQDENIIRTVLFLLSGLVYLLVGFRMLRAKGDIRDKALLPFGIAISFFTLSVAMLLSGPSITMVWAIEGAVLAWLSSKAKGKEEHLAHPGWLIASLSLFAIAGLHLLTKDVMWVQDQYYLFHDSLGQKGTLLPMPFFNPQAMALAAFGICALLGASWFKGVRDRPVYVPSALVILVLGHLALLVLFISQARLLVTSSPPVLPADLPVEEFSAMLASWQSTVSAQGARIDTVTTVVMGLYSLVLLLVGFGMRDRVHRILGLGLFGLALAKLGLFDIWELSTVLKMVVGASIAALLLSGAFLYGRFGHRIRSMLAEADKTVILLLLPMAVLLFPQNTQAAQWEKYSRVWAIKGVDKAGYHSFEIPPALYAQSKSSMRDIRIQAPDGNDAPWTIRSIRSAAIKKPIIAAKLLDPVVLPGASTRVVLDLGPHTVIHNSVFLDIAGENFMRSVIVESSDDLRIWGLLSDKEQVSNITAKDFKLNRTMLSYPATQARYLRITLLADRTRTPLKILGARVMEESSTKSQAPTFRKIALMQTSKPKRDKADTLFSLEPLTKGVPFRVLEFEVADDEFSRQVTVEGSTRGYAWISTGTGSIHRVYIGKGTKASWLDENLHVSFFPAGRPLIRIRIKDENNPPLRIKKVYGIYKPQELVFRAREAGEYRLFAGREDDHGADYDLSALLERDPTRLIAKAELGPAGPNLMRQGPQENKKRLPFTERYSLWIKIILGILAGTLLLWTLLVIRKSQSHHKADD